MKSMGRIQRKTKRNAYSREGMQFLLVFIIGSLLVTVSKTEECIQGNTSSSIYGCINGQVRSGWSCVTVPPNPSVCTQICGDGILTIGEGCDDANAVEGDGCSSNCTIEPGWTCRKTPSVCFEFSVANSQVLYEQPTPPSPPQYSGIVLFLIFLTCMFGFVVSVILIWKAAFFVKSKISKKMWEE